MTSFSSSPLVRVVWVPSAGVWEDSGGFSARLLPQKGFLLRFDRPQVMRRCSRVIWDASEISVSTQLQGEKSAAASLARLRCSPAARPLGAGEALRLRFGGIVEVVQRPPLVSDVTWRLPKKTDVERVQVETLIDSRIPTIMLTHQPRYLLHVY